MTSQVIYKIPQKMSGTGTIHDIANSMFDREIIFAPGARYAVILASYYGGKGYTTHKTTSSVIIASRRNKQYSHRIIDMAGNEYAINGDCLVKI